MSVVASFLGYKMGKKELLKTCMSKGFLLDKEMLILFEELSDEGCMEVIEAISDLKLKERVINKKLFEENFDAIKGSLLKFRGGDSINTFFTGMGYLGGNGEGSEEILEKLNEEKESSKKPFKILSAPAFIQRKIVVNDFIKHFRSRYEKLKKILETKDFENLTSIRKIGKNKGNYTLIVAVANKRITKNKNILLEVEDMTGTAMVLVNNNKKELYNLGKDVLKDDIIAINLMSSGTFMFANEIVYPEASLSEKRKSDSDVWVAFISDLHTGSKMFLEKNFLKFVKWLNGGEGDNSQRALAEKIKYLFVVGDVIDGVSHYPGQENELDIKTARGQYGQAEDLFKLIRKDIEMIICPGNHDAVWVGEPQPIIGENFAPELHKMENVTLVPNPSLIELEEGFKVLMYHGGSINFLIEEFPEIRTKYKHNAPTRVVKEMVKRRHLAPIHGLADYIPCEEDGLVIDNTPDIIVTADQHRSEVSMMNNILLVASSCWQSITPFEEKVGNNPEPCRVPLFNLKTREIKILDFSDPEEEITEAEKCEDTVDGLKCEVKEK
jgi:DNA polymerase II small subunit